MSSDRWDEHGRLIDGVIVLRHPPGDGALAVQIGTEIRHGGCVCLPTATDQWGNFLWGFRIEGGDESQVRLERSDELSKGKIG